MICRLVPSSQGAFVYPVPVSELFKRLLISAWREKWTRWNQTNKGQTAKTVSKQSCWHEQTVLNAGTAAEPALPTFTDKRGGNAHAFVYSLYLCSFDSRGHMESGGTLNDLSNLFFLLPETRLVGVKKTPELLQRLFQQNLIGRIVLLLSPDRYHSSWVITPLTVY